MVDGIGQADIRGIDIDKATRGFADEASVLRKLVMNSKTKAREIRWFQKTAGFLDSTDTTGITLSMIALQTPGALPPVVGQTWTRNTSYVKEFIVESELISDADIKDNDVDVFGTTLRDLIRGVNNQVDIRIYSVLIEAAAATPTTPAPSNTLTTAATADGWDDAVTGDPIRDIMTGNRKLRAQGIIIDTNSKPILYINPIEHENLVLYIMSVKGSSWPGFSSNLLATGAIMEILSNDVVVSQNATTDNALQFMPGLSCVWKEFTPLQSAIIDEKLVGKKIRVRAEGEALLVFPKSVHQITNTAIA